MGSMMEYLEESAREWRDSASHWRKEWDGQWEGVDGTHGAPPAIWVTATRLLGQDIGCGLLANVVDLEGASWHLFISPDGFVMIELHIIRDGKESGFISNDELTPSECSEQHAVLWLADLVHGDLTGYHHILWPEIGGRLFEPTIVDGRPHWADRGGKDKRVFDIGRLDASTSALGHTVDQRD